MNGVGRGFMRKAMRLLGAGSPMPLATDELFAIRPGASVTPTVAYGPGGERTTDEERKPYRMLEGGIAEIAVTGVLSKHVSIFRLFGCSDQPTLGELTEAVEAARADSNVRGLMLFIDSPGGTVAGTPEFAAAVARVAEEKPVHAHAEDCCASAAYWPAAQAHRITANRIAEVGGIGVFAVLLDASKAAGAEGLKFHVLASGPFKGAGMAPGAGISEEQLAYLQQRIDDAAIVFVDDVAAGRGVPANKAKAWADGRCHIASRALALGLIDGIGTYAEAVEALRASLDSPPQPRSATPPHPEEPEPDDPPTPPLNPGEEETAMSDQKKEASGATGAEEQGLFEKFKAWLAGGQPAAAAPPPTPPVGLTAEQARAIAKEEYVALNAADRVDADLAKLEGKATPAAIAKAKPRLLKAALEGRSDDYAYMLEELQGKDASALLGAPIAGESQTGSATTGYGMSARELAACKALGMSDAELVAVTAKYDLTGQKPN